MRQQLPKEIDPFRFANQGRELEGELKISDMTRLSEMLHSDEGVVAVKMRFGIDHTGTPYVEGQFETTLSLTCERCMQAMSWPVNVQTLLGLVRHEKLAETLSDQYEPWVVDDTELVEPAMIVEDELILTLPIIAKHEQDCLPEDAWFSGEKEEDEQVEKPASPFSVLSSLKTKK